MEGSLFIASGLFAEALLTFVVAGGFFSWLTFSIYRLRKSNHDIRNSLHKIGLMLEDQYGKTPWDDVDGERER